MDFKGKSKPLLYLFLGFILMALVTYSIYAYFYSYDLLWLFICCVFATSILGIITLLYFIVTAIKIILKHE